MSPAYQAVEIAGKHRRELLDGEEGQEEGMYILPFPVGELLFWKIFLAKIHLLKKKKKIVKSSMFCFFLGYFYLHKVTKNQPRTHNKGTGTHFSSTICF